MKTYSQRTAASTCTLVMCSPMENGLPGRDGRDGREGPRGEKGDPGRAGAMGSSWWKGVGIGIVTSRERWMCRCGRLRGGLLPPQGWVSLRRLVFLKHCFTS